MSGENETESNATSSIKEREKGVDRHKRERQLNIMHCVCNTRNENDMTGRRSPNTRKETRLEMATKQHMICTHSLCVLCFYCRSLI